MRHVKASTYNYIDGAANRPYGNEYKFTNPTPTSSYVRVLKFIDEHPRCKRREIQRGVWGNDKHSNSDVFAQMLYADLIDYNEKFEYVVRRKGKSILKKVSKQKGAK